MASQKSYADILKNARKGQGKTTSQASASSSNNITKKDKKSQIFLGPKPSPINFSDQSATSRLRGPSWASVAKGIKDTPNSIKTIETPVPVPATVPTSGPTTVTAKAPKPKPVPKTVVPATPLSLVTPPEPPPSKKANKSAVATTTTTNVTTTKKKTKANMLVASPARVPIPISPKKKEGGIIIPPSPSESIAALSSPVSRPWTPSSVQSQPFTVASVQHAPFAHLWSNPQNADVQIVCQGASWVVHRHVLVSTSDWMEKYMPPASKPDSSMPVLWRLDNWNPGILSAVLRFTYLEEYPGGDYSPKDPFNTRPIVAAVAHFLAGTACLHRPLMEHTLQQIEHAALEIQTLTPLFRGQKGQVSNNFLDCFSDGLRIAMAITYDEPDQWRVRALRVVMGKLMAVAFPILLQSPRWGAKYCTEWGPLQGRIVADHLWLTDNDNNNNSMQQEEKKRGRKKEGAKKSVLSIERNEFIIAGYEHMDLLWKDYRIDGWKPTDDLMFPERGGDDPSDLRPMPPPPSLSSPNQEKTPLPETDTNNNNDNNDVDGDDGAVAGLKGRGRRRSRAIPIMRPDGSCITLPKPNEESPPRGGRKPVNGGKPDDNMGPPPPPALPRKPVSSRAQSWPRCPQPGFSTAVPSIPPASLASGLRDHSPIKGSALCHALVPSEPPPEDTDSRDIGPTDSVSEASQIPEPKTGDDDNAEPERGASQEVSKEDDKGSQATLRVPEEDNKTQGA